MESAILSSLVGKTVSIWSINGGAEYKDVGEVVAADGVCIKITSGDQSLIYPLYLVRLIKVDDDE